jgi:PPOX class probable F420-dependent enzyme
MYIFALLEEIKMSMIPNSHKDLLENAYIGIFTTVSPKNKPENTAVWYSWDGEYILVNSAEGRRKPDNIRKNPNVALFVLDPKDPYRWIDVRGIVEAIEPDANYSNINYHAQRYVGVDEYYGGFVPLERKGAEERIIFKIKPVHVTTRGQAQVQQQKS